ncbi:MAG: carbohydrate kinase, partial [Spirochaetia bacterium]|nr:carbohydrate kinase [Spirochaetia bacterium]
METIAVLDIGKTNKKILLFDKALKVQAQVTKNFDPLAYEGIRIEDTQGLVSWLAAEFKKLSVQYDIKCVSVTTHGATIACLDEKGELVYPVIDYTIDPGEAFHKEFYEFCGSADRLQRETATPNLGSLINPAKTLFYLKRKAPQAFSRIRHILNYPQYFGHLMTGKPGMEPTYVGCHTYLWDLNKKAWSDVAKKLGVTSFLPTEMKNSWSVLGTVSPSWAGKSGLAENALVTMGIHDSNASLLPYLVQNHGDFVLNSTGTWCVAMHPGKSLSFADDEIGKIVFYNLDAFDRPVKTAIFMGGLEYDSYAKVLAGLHPGKTSTVYNADLYQKIVREKKYFIIPGVVQGTGQFPTSSPNAIGDDITVSLEELQSGKNFPAFFKDYDVAIATLNLSVAIQTKVALDRAGVRAGTSIYTEGGFRKNEGYNRLLSAFYPESKVALTSMAEATAFGAALLGKAALDQVTPLELKKDFSIEFQDVAATRLEGLDE